MTQAQRPPVQIDGVIFDLDGLLLDTEPILRRVDTETVARYGGVLTDELRQQTLGLTHEAKDKLFVEALGLSASPAILSDQRAQMLTEAFQLADLMPGAVELVAALASTGVPLALASSSTAAAIHLKLERHPSITAHLTVFVGSDHPRSFPEACAGHLSRRGRRAGRRSSPLPCLRGRPVWN